MYVLSKMFNICLIFYQNIKYILSKILIYVPVKERERKKHLIDQQNKK